MEVIQKFNMKNIFSLLFFILICYLCAYIGSLYTFTSVSTWYSTIKKPSWGPPNWVFGPVWTILYTLMGISAWIASQEKDKKRIRIPLLLFFIQLFFNSIWSFLFFYLKNPLFGLIDIIILWIFIVLTIFSFYKVNKTASYLLIPYILWVSFASAINYFIVILN